MGKKTSKSVSRLVIEAGAFPPSVQVQQFTHVEWEEFIEACCEIRKGPGKLYSRVQRLGGPGDAGRDIEARLVPDLITDQWDLYQAKHYKSPFTPGEFFPELASFFCHLVKKTYPRPRRYFLCAPANAGPDLHDLIANPELLKARFLSAWQSGKTGLKGMSKLLTPAVLTEINGFPFERIDECLLKDLLDVYSQDEAAYSKRFHITPIRGDDPAVPILPAQDEQIYVEELVSVYSEHALTPLTLDEVLKLKNYAEHFEACRAEFYCAEGLKRFSRDIFPDEFSRLLDMIHDGIRSAVNHPRHADGFARLDAAINRLPSIALTDSKLHPRLRGGDLPGSCHHLVNEGRIKWVR